MNEKVVVEQNHNRIRQQSAKQIFDALAIDMIFH